MSRRTSKVVRRLLEVGLRLYRGIWMDWSARRSREGVPRRVRKVAVDGAKPLESLSD